MTQRLSPPGPQLPETPKKAHMTSFASPENIRTSATLRMAGPWSLTPIEQEMFVKAARRLQPLARVLGRRGATNVRLKLPEPSCACSRAAWRLLPLSSLFSILRKTFFSWRP